MKMPFAALAAIALLAAQPAAAQTASEATAEQDGQSVEPTAEAQTDAADQWLPSLMTDNPQAGFDLAMSMARKAVTTTQTEKEVLHALRPNYSHDPQSLIDVSGVAAAWFATIAEANDYWRE